MGSTEDISLSLSTIVIGSSSRSLIDLSWLSPVPAEKEQAPLYAPEWISGIGAAVHSESTIKVLIAGCYYSFLIEKYPTSEESVELLRHRVKLHQGTAKASPRARISAATNECGGVTGSGVQASGDVSSIEYGDGGSGSANNGSSLASRLFFLWDRAGSELAVARNNASAVKKHLKLGHSERIESTAKIWAEILKLSLDTGISFVPLDESTVESALVSLQRSIDKQKKGRPVIALKKRADPSDVLKEMVGSVTGITAAEVDAIVRRFRSTRGLLEEVLKLKGPEAYVPVDGVRKKVLVAIRSLFTE
ncbi:hypothetical protein NEHOM01_1390 [Nematocida homosporus]|uniref:uncharacterized protein n=1 Tax=Nematocida homosporus TaxID=1912981 RepID=UPI00221F2A48|nr:uncharacterized protein NEHOM01_1390 [Nematocida homosporus]KAI5186326.1 hypothetical protein NEHOM01_1390 [Nematocida homosporus]